jgi:hypothetical protein
MTSVRVDLPTVGRVDRTLPVLLHGHMSQDAWDTFCDDLDKEIVAARGGQLCLIITPLALFLVSVLIMVLSFLTRSMLAFFVLPILWVVGIGGLVCFTCNLGNRIKQNLQIICEKESQKYHDLSFHVKEQVFHTYDTDGRGTRTTWYRNPNRSADGNHL